jgi:hypothetical protein
VYKRVYSVYLYRFQVELRCDAYQRSECHAGKSRRSHGEVSLLLLVPAYHELGLISLKVSMLVCLIYERLYRIYDLQSPGVDLICLGPGLHLLVRLQVDLLCLYEPVSEWVILKITNRFRFVGEVPLM